MQDTPKRRDDREWLPWAAPRQWCLFLDIDGTLVGMASSPDAVSVAPGLVELLARIAHGLDGAVSLITGRRIADADRLFAPLKLMGAGVHGTEVRVDRGGSVKVLAPPIPADVMDGIIGVTKIASGIMVEQKGAGVAVHYRNAPASRPALLAELKRVVANSRLELALRGGRMVVEILPRQYSKGKALTQLADLAPFRGRRPIMIGDDVGDESALVAAERLGGLGLRVAGEHFSRSASTFDGVDGVHEWLSAFAQRLEEPDRAGRLTANLQNSA
jgi:trehalose 6-phosphate phosphatase